MPATTSTDPVGMRRRVDFRRRSPDPSLQPYVEHYWLIDWAVEEPFAQRVLPHPAVNIVFRADDDRPETGEIAGPAHRLFVTRLAGTGRVCGVQFRPGGFRPFWGRPVSELTDRHVPLDGGGSICAGTDDDRCRALDALLTALRGAPDPLATRAVGLVEAIRGDRSVLRVDEFADRRGLPVRTLQRLFAEHVGMSPKAVIRRYRLHEAIEQAPTGVDWATLAADLGYADQAHLVRDFTATIGLSPTAYARAVCG
jgi:AraC-like DNA-binding protein